jgi:thioredoxin reductase (NADPH)
MFDLIIIGAGPAGLAAAIAARSRGLTYLVIEKGALVNSLLHFPVEMVFFTTPELMEIGGMPFVSPHDKPTRMESLRYYRRVTDTFQLAVALHETVTGLRRGADELFRVTSQPAHGEPILRQSRAVIVAIGAYDVPNRIDVPGEDLPHVSHFYEQPHAHYRQRVVIVGGKNSAAETALDLYRAGAKVLLVHRGQALGESIKYWVKPDIENRIKEGSIAARFETRLAEITPTEVVLDGPDGRVREAADAVLLMTGYRADTSLLKTAGADVEPTQWAPVHDPETFESTVPNLFVIGACVAGKASGRIFIENGRFHGEVAVRTIAERLKSEAPVKSRD